MTGKTDQGGDEQENPGMAESPADGSAPQFDENGDPVPGMPIDLPEEREWHDDPKGPISDSMANNALTPVRQSLLGKPRDETRSLRLERRGQNLARAFAGDLSERVDDRSGLGKRGDRGVACHGVSLLREVLAGFSTRHDTPPFQAPSAIFGHSSICDSRISKDFGRKEVGAASGNSGAGPHAGGHSKGQSGQDTGHEPGHYGKEDDPYRKALELVVEQVPLRQAAP